MLSKHCFAMSCSVTSSCLFHGVVCHGVICCHVLSSCCVMLDQVVRNFKVFDVMWIPMWSPVVGHGHVKVCFIC